MIEHGKATPSADLLGKLAGALDCDMDDLHV
jgi:transcriptional regulator with XRE-family HTH domain